MLLLLLGVALNASIRQEDLGMKDVLLARSLQPGGTGSQRLGLGTINFRSRQAVLR